LVSYIETPDQSLYNFKNKSVQFQSNSCTISK
jgi:hypothetical protein